MNKITLIAAALVVCCIGKAQTFTAKLTGLDSDTAYIITAPDGKYQYDTLVCNNGAFTYNYEGTKVRQAYFMPFQSDGGHKYQAFFLVPGEQGVMTGTIEDVTWSGTQFYADYAKACQVIDPIQRKRDSLIIDFNSKVLTTTNKDSLRNAMMPAYNQAGTDIANACLNFIKANPGSNASASLLGMVGEVDDCEVALNALSAEVKAGPFSDYIADVQQYVASERIKQEAAKKVAPGKEAPDFTLKDINGNDLSLSSLRGKIVVIDFWGSWCGWCIKGFPEMKKYYEKYPGKFEILGVDCNDTEDKWKQAVADNQLPWKQVYNPRKGDVPQRYAVSGFPTKVVVGADGKILKTIVGEDPAFYTYLDELLK